MELCQYQSSYSIGKSYNGFKYGMNFDYEFIVYFNYLYFHFKAWLLCSLVSSMCWVIYITFYNSRVVGYILTKLLNRLSMKGAYFKIGMF